jgi:hypothetical protein
MSVKLLLVSTSVPFSALSNKQINAIFYRGKIKGYYTKLKSKKALLACILGLGFTGPTNITDHELKLVCMQFR